MKTRALAAVLCVAALVPAVAFAGSRLMHPRLAATLVGSVEVPKKGAPKGHGIVFLTLDAARRSLCWRFVGVGGIDKPTAAHIHRAPGRRAGPVVVSLGVRYTAKGCTSAPRKAIRALESHPNDYYVNVHTARYPGGAIRGQLIAATGYM